MEILSVFKAGRDTCKTQGTVLAFNQYICLKTNVCTGDQPGKTFLYIPVGFPLTDVVLKLIVQIIDQDIKGIGILWQICKTC